MQKRLPEEPLSVGVRKSKLGSLNRRLILIDKETLIPHQEYERRIDLALVIALARKV